MEATHEKPRNKVADKLLEALDLAKSLDFAAYDFRRLRPGSRNLLFVWRNLRFVCDRPRLEMPHKRNST
jgi:hypothetical protein